MKNGEKHSGVRDGSLEAVIKKDEDSANSFIEAEEVLYLGQLSKWYVFSGMGNAEERGVEELSLDTCFGSLNCSHRI